MQQPIAVGDNLTSDSALLQSLQEILFRPEARRDCYASDIFYSYARVFLAGQSLYRWYFYSYVEPG